MSIASGSTEPDAPFEKNVERLRRAGMRSLEQHAGAIERPREGCAAIAWDVLECALRPAGDVSAPSVERDALACFEKNVRVGEERQMRLERSAVDEG